MLLAAQHFNRVFSEKFKVDTSLDVRILYLAVKSAYDDIERYKAYHLERPYRDRSDSVKRAAYLTKWLTKFGPFQTVFDPDIDLDKPLPESVSELKSTLANITFSIKLAERMISYEVAGPFKISSDAEYQLTYDLLYRRIDEDSLLATYQTLLDVAKDG